MYIIENVYIFDRGVNYLDGGGILPHPPSPLPQQGKGE